MKPQRAVTDEAPRTNNPYSQAVRTDDTLYISGYGPVDPKTGEEIEGDIRAETDRVLDNIAACVEAAGGDGRVEMDAVAYLSSPTVVNEDERKPPVGDQ